MSVFRMSRRLVEQAAKASYFVAALCILAMMVQVGIDAAARTIFGSPITGTLEIVSNWYMVGITFLPLALIEFRREHLIVELFTQGLSPRRVAVLDALMQTISAILLLVWTASAIEMAVAKTAISESLDAVFFEVPIWPTRWVFAFGTGLCGLAFAVSAIETIWFGLTRRALAPAPTPKPMPGASPAHQGGATGQGATRDPHQEQDQERTR